MSQELFIYSINDSVTIFTDATQAFEKLYADTSVFLEIIKNLPKITDIVTLYCLKLYSQNGDKITDYYINHDAELCRDGKIIKWCDKTCSKLFNSFCEMTHNKLNVVTQIPMFVALSIYIRNKKNLIELTEPLTIIEPVIKKEIYLDMRQRVLCTSKKSPTINVDVEKDSEKIPPMKTFSIKPGYMTSSNEISAPTMFGKFSQKRMPLPDKKDVIKKMEKFDRVLYEELVSLDIKKISKLCVKDIEELYKLCEKTCGEYRKNVELMDDEKAYEKLNDMRKILKKKSEKAQEMRNIFSANKNIYTRLKALTDNKIIPILFSEHYPIFRYLDKEKKINFENDDNLEEEFILFQEIFDKCNGLVEGIQKKKPMQPHNYEYLTKEEKKIYEEKILQFELDNEEKISVDSEDSNEEESDEETNE